ncbi:PEP/pyruvate-binding domain-containing protein [Buchananella hordeovulneris]|uniref:PEP/pyruvate-binding domain-containing protein n=1 Tax=Buchananella hordeovulneris TaxID=52770 RepID=UPI000F5F350C|nr:PEP/pyruvate-binding domain-containing protein [Buchananella hordeovulneris]RRD43433.1 hypothetical protein EII13_06895 [Buchananella hordeovulneris]
MILWFTDITAADHAQVGGKGANLGECTRAGLPVPPGFCLTTAAYRAATREITELLAADADAGTARAARQRILDLPLPGGLRQEVERAYACLGRPPVAVRSSATAEDLADASFAGQQDTYLGVVGLEALLAAIKHCWASLWSDRAVAYRRRQGVANAGLALGVVVQQLVDADVAGVLFTRDPVQGHAQTMLASAAYGLGESVVASLVTPDTFTLRRRPAAVVGRELGSKETRIDRLPDGGTATRQVPAEQRARACLTDAQLLQLLALGERVEAHYGAGQDIEWALAGGELHLLQARPITTTVPTVPSHQPVRGRAARRLQDDLIEHFPAPYPLDLWAVHQVQGAIQALARRAGLRAPTAEELVRGDDDGVVRLHVTKPRLTPAMLTRLPRLFAHGMGHDPATWPHREARLRETLQELTAQVANPVTLADAELLPVARAAVGQAAALTGARFVHYLAPMLVSRAAVAGLLRLAWPPREVSPEDLYAGLNYRTAEITAAISNLAATARRCDLAETITAAEAGMVGAAVAGHGQGPAFRAALDAFLAQYGARTARLYLPFSNRSWREDPESFYALLAAALRGGAGAAGGGSVGVGPEGENATVGPGGGCSGVDGSPPPEPSGGTRPAAGPTMGAGAGTDALAGADASAGAGTPTDLPPLAVAVERRLPRLLRRRWRAAVARLRAQHLAREGSVYLLEEFFCVARGALDEVARRLVARGQLAEPSDLRFLYLPEVERALADTGDLRAVVARRRGRRGVAEAVWWERGAAGQASADLRGVPASGGRATGVARIIRSPADFARLQAGDVLVCPYTDPTWTPLFSLAVAVVTQTGGPLSHAAIVAREYGIPAVMGLAQALSLPDGTRLLVDGSRGLVTVLD